MKDASPRIFRSLERQFGLGEFDTVVAAAVATFSSLRHPNSTQVEDLSRLVVPLWARIRNDTKRNVAASLSHARRVPRSLVELLIESPVEVSAPFLVSSPVLSEADLATLAASQDERVAKLVRNRDARGALPPQAPFPAAPEPAAKPQGAAPRSEPVAMPAPQEPSIEAPSLAADFLSETPFNARMPAPGRRLPPRNADEARELLRRLATAGRGPVKRGMPDLGDLMNAAFAREDVLFYEILTEIFALDTTTLERIVSEPSGETLAVALKALKANSADAMSILMLMKPGIGLDVAAFDSMARFYKALPPEECRSLIQTARDARHAPLTSPEVYRTLDPARRDFGRRILRPASREAKG